MKTYPKICLFCEHFDMDFGSPHYSSWTPGYPGHMTCWKNHFNQWEKETGKDPEWHYREVILMAETCPDFVKSAACDDIEVEE